MSMLDEKRIETLTMKVKDIKTGFGNPRKIGKKEAEELEESLEKYGDFGLFLIDEHDNVIAGNQRLSILQRKDGDIEVLCKRLIGYTKSELRAINIKDKADCKEDVDKILQELMYNRIILMPKYLAMYVKTDTNEGGDNINKNSKVIRECNEYMKLKWGKYYTFDDKKNTVTIKVPR